MEEIDAVLVLEAVLRVIKGSKLLDFKKASISDHREFLFDADFKDYFVSNNSTCGKSEERKLNPANRKCKRKLNNILKQLYTKTVINPNSFPKKRKSC